MSTKRYFLEIAYHGKNYCGWQIQPNKPTVQQTLCEALSVICNSQIEVTGCGRTDSGVHASQFFVHFDVVELPGNFLHRLNRFLPKDIAAKRVLDDVPATAHTRFDAFYRAYTYQVHFEKSPFLHEQSFFFPWKLLNREAMQQVCQGLTQYTHFPMFCKSGGSAKTDICHIYKAKLVFNDEQGTMFFHIAANRFLRGMVRRIMGCLLMVGKNKISVDEFQMVMDNRKKKFEKMNISVPPQGLFLVEVRYPYVKYK